MARIHYSVVAAHTAHMQGNLLGTRTEGWCAAGATAQCTHVLKSKSLSSGPYFIQLEEVAHDIRQLEAGKIIYLDLHSRKDANRSQ